MEQDINKEIMKKYNITEQELSEAVLNYSSHVYFKKDPKTGEFPMSPDEMTKATMAMAVESYLKNDIKNMDFNKMQQIKEEVRKEYNLTKEEFYEAMTGPRPSIVWSKDTPPSDLEKYRGLISMQVSSYAEAKKKQNMEPQQLKQMEKELKEKYNLTDKEYLEAMSINQHMTYNPKTRPELIDQMRAEDSMKIESYLQNKTKNMESNKLTGNQIIEKMMEKYNLTREEVESAMKMYQSCPYHKKENFPKVHPTFEQQVESRVEGYLIMKQDRLLDDKSQNNTWWYHEEPDEIKEKLMKEYQLTLEEYTEVTKPPICVLGKKDPITGIRKFPEYKKLTKDEIIKYKREDIERTYRIFKELSVRDIKKHIKERYNISTEELLFAISSATSNLKNKPPIRIRRDWSLMVEAYLRGKKEKEELLKDKKPEYSSGASFGKISIDAQDLSIESIEKKAKVTHEKAVYFMKIINKHFLITPQGLIQKEKDPVLKYTEPVIIKRADKYEKIYERAIPIIKELIASGERDLGTYILSKKLKVSYKTTKIILKMLNEMRIIEYIYGEVHPKII